MKILTLTTLYPNAASPSHGVFVENRIDFFRRRTGAEFRIVAPVPWFPSPSPVFGHYARFARAPMTETRREIEVTHPRYAIPPKVGMSYAAAALARVFEREARRLLSDGFDFDLIDAHYLYPDGVAATAAARRLGKPVVMTARGSDVTELAAFPRQRRMILDAVLKADAVISVAQALKHDLVALGAPAEKIRVLRNGVDLAVFKPTDRAAARAGIGVAGPVLASVGSLIPRKGHDIAIRALDHLPQATLLIAGEGPEGAALRALAGKLGVAARVRFLGQVRHEALVDTYNAADALLLASTREGWPNVLLEAMACGTPAISADAGGAREVIRDQAAGRVVSERTSEAFAAAVRDVLATTNRAATRAYAERHSWDETSDGQAVLFDEILDNHRRRRATVIRRAATPARERPRLLFTVDAEEEFDWSDFTPDRHKTGDPEGLARLSGVVSRHGVKPLHFITYPLLTNARFAGWFRSEHETGRADLGLHLHQWATPPAGGYSGEYYSWQANLPRTVHREKLGAMTAAFERAFGFHAIAHRAGRYGVAPESYDDLAEAGVRLDFSPCPPFDFSARGGPDFSSMGNDPFTVDTEKGAVFVTPVCGALAIRGGRRFLTGRGAAGFGSAARPAAPRALTAPFRLSCEQARFEELVALTHHLAREGVPVLTFSLHSTTLTPGANAYAPDKASVDGHLDMIARYLDFFTNSFRGEVIDLSALDALYRDGR
ncbi:MAG: glycosyltransferase [Parvularculaceae bacterium]|nr:glycosyltransferase [Parvularculaceae bacterium]